MSKGKGSTAMTAEQVRVIQGRRGSGASGTHGDRRTKRLRTRASQKKAAVSEYR